ncbi:uncharacterized protein LOC130917134 [Corythoichthys intestinalis]|uniref:uncharacterized protein LOC130917134 n=1 Tax=Corythoichthys intestinalis TaxID=161448 RepID=UPI0025A5D5C6|nr:uncharacterized protein LOC130917134 [Corythoichthys intestinalis]
MLVHYYLALLYLWMTKETLCYTDTKVHFEFNNVTLGKSHALKCYYNCSVAFVRGCWSKTSDNSVCLGEINHKSCRVTLHLPVVSSEDLKYNYTCYTKITDDPQLRQKTQLVVSLYVKGDRSAQTWTVAPSNIPAKPRDPNGAWKFTEIRVLATFSIAVVTALIALIVYLRVNRNRCSRNGDHDDDEHVDDGSRSGSLLHSRDVLTTVNVSSSFQSEQPTLRIASPDNESLNEVPYAEIVISVRGVSTPELTQVNLTTEDSQQWRGCESMGHMLASRSIDRLHLPQPREVSRKMSTNSEYAVITYA